MIFKLDIEFTIGFDSKNSNIQNISLALNLSNQKRKQKRNLGLFNNVVFLAEV